MRREHIHGQAEALHAQLPPAKEMAFMTVSP